MNIDARIVWEDAIANSVGNTGYPVSLPPSYIPGDIKNIEKRRNDGRRKYVKNLVNRILNNRKKREKNLMKKYNQIREFFDGLDAYEIDIDGIGTIKVPINGPAKLVKTSSKKKPNELQLRPYRAIKPEVSDVNSNETNQVSKESRQKNVIEKFEYIEESGGKVIDQLKKIVNSKKIGIVTFKNGQRRPLSSVNASRILKLYNNLNASNKVKLIRTINASPASLNTIRDFMQNKQ